MDTQWNIETTFSNSHNPNNQWPLIPGSGLNLEPGISGHWERTVPMVKLVRASDLTINPSDERTAFDADRLIRLTDSMRDGWDSRLGVALVTKDYEVLMGKVRVKILKIIAPDTLVPVRFAERDSPE